MAYVIEITRPAVNELKAIRVFDRRRIVDAMEEQLKDQPLTVTRNRKPLGEAEPDFEHQLPLWELRVRDYRVFYDVDEAAQKVFVRAVRSKKQGQTTEDIIHERNDD